MGSLSVGHEEPGVHCVYRGAGKLYVDEPWDSRILPLAVQCVFSGLEDDRPYLALLDTAARFCVMETEVAVLLGIDLAAQPEEVRLMTAYGTMTGALHKHAVRIPAVRGDDLVLEPFWLVAENWVGPTVLGWAGFLQAVAFGCDPGVRAEDEGAFYFSPL